MIGLYSYTPLLCVCVCVCFSVFLSPPPLLLPSPQADICHAYQVLHAHGVPDDHIVVMMYDDIAHNEENPNPGVIINHLKGPNVYPGVPHDYTKEAVTPENFLKILTGENMNGTGSGKTIQSGPDDYVFVYFADHGAPGIVAFPDKMLSAKKWNEAITKMHQENRYKQMVVYVEACESGSMFDKLLSDNINVYVTTASNPHESSYACYMDDSLETYLGDCYSVNWMEDVDNLGTTQTLKAQYKKVKRETTTSHVEQYGDLSLDSEELEMFMGSKNSGPAGYSEPQPVPQARSDAVPSGDVPISILTHKIFKTPNEWEKREYEQKLLQELQLRESVRQTVKTIVESVVEPEAVDGILHKPASPVDFDCLEAVVDRFSSACFPIGKVDYALRHVYALVNLCEAGIPSDKIMQSINSAC
ncbi:Legumain [Geodia barretti]|uniref:legumain n=1 Tax=Geodia barretti TaxID=519541 RepID=A0AA35S7T7_GEOBA|nr:Legumain [Geodia barretti]